MKPDLLMLMELAIAYCPILKNEINQLRNRFSGISWTRGVFLCIVNSKHVLNRLYD